MTEKEPSHKKKRRTRSPLGGAERLGRESVETRRTAALILEVLGGVRTPTEAAEVLGVSAARYYALEGRALEGLVAACRKRPRGPTRSPEREIARLKRELERLQSECARSQALLRVAQRAVGITSLKPRNGKKSAVREKRARKRKPTKRALRAAELLRVDGEENPLEATDTRREDAAELK